MIQESVTSSEALNTHVTPKNGSRVASIASRLSHLHFIPRLIGYARITYLVGIVLALIVVSPIDWIPTPLLKIALYAVILAITVILFALGGGIRVMWRAP